MAHSIKRCLRSMPILLACVLAAPICSGKSQSPDDIKVIYVIPSSHWDLGFLLPPEQEMDAIKPHLDSVLDACESDSQFRWTIESVWQLQAWLDRTKDPVQIARLTALLRKGQIELSAAEGSMHTEFMGSEELNRSVYAAKDAERRFGIQASVAMVNDVPGFSGRVTQALARSGVTHLITGSNTIFGGGTSLSPGKVPFYWESADGSKVLVWQTQGKNGGYPEAMADYYIDPEAEDPYLHTKFHPKEWDALPKLEIMQRGVDKLLKEYREAGYRHSAIALLYMHDGIGPQYELQGLLPNVRAWNAAGKTPQIVVATPSEFFSHIEQEGTQNFPVYHGDWGGLWADVKVNSPAMSADARWLQDRLPETEALWSLLNVQAIWAEYPAQALAKNYRELFLYDEHNGSGQSGWPKVLTRQQVIEQNQQYSDFLRPAVSSTSDLLQSGVEKFANTEDTKQNRRLLLVYNPLSWATSQLVQIPHIEGFYVIRDASTGQVMKSQRLMDGELYFEALQVPAMGYRTYSVEPDKAGKPAFKEMRGLLLESPFFQVEVNPTTGSIYRITDRRLGRLIVNAAQGDRAADLVRSSEFHDDSMTAKAVGIRHVRGPLVDQIVIDRKEGVWPQTVITLPLDDARVDITETLQRSKMRFVNFGHPSDQYAFDFVFSFNAQPQQWIENGEGLYRVPQDLLPGARTDATVPRHTVLWCDESGKAPFAMMLAQKQAFFDVFQETKDQHGPASAVHRGLRIKALSKQDQGDTKDQGVVSFDTYEPGYPDFYSYSFSLTSSSGPADPVSAFHFGSESDARFVSAFLPQGRRPSQWVFSLLSLSTPNVIVQAFKPSRGGQPGEYTLRLQEIAGETTNASLRFAAPITSVTETTMTEDRDITPRSGLTALHFAPHQTLTLRLSIGRAVTTDHGVQN